MHIYIRISVILCARSHPDLDSVIQGMITTPQCPHVATPFPGKIMEVIAFALAHKWMLEVSGEKTENASMKVLISLALPGIGPIVIYVQTLVQTLLANGSEGCFVSIYIASVQICLYLQPILSPIFSCICVHESFKSLIIICRLTIDSLLYVFTSFMICLAGIIKSIRD